MQAPAVVFDCGSSSTRVGLAHCAAPHTFPTLISQLNDTIYVGPQNKGIINGYVNNFDHLHKIWDHGFTVSGVTPENHPIVLNKPYYPCTKNHCEKIAQIMFEDFRVPALHLTYPPVLSLYSHGLLTGLVVQSGYKETPFYPIYEGHILERAIMRGLPVAGQYITDFFLNSLLKKGYMCDYDTANEIKEKCFFVSSDVNTEKDVLETFVLPDGNAVTLTKEKYLIPEELYKSSIEYCGMHEFIFHRLYRCDPHLREVLFKNIVLSGGNTLLPGFAERLQQELIKALPDYKFMSKATPEVIAPTNRKESVWIGGTLLSKLSTFPGMCMSLNDYNEYGPYYVNKIFF